MQRRISKKVVVSLRFGQTVGPCLDCAIGGSHRASHKKAGTFFRICPYGNFGVCAVEPMDEAGEKAVFSYHSLGSPVCGGGRDSPAVCAGKVLQL